MTTPIPYFYDQQIRRYLTQIVRAFSGFQYQVAGRDGSGPVLRQVPCTMATKNRQIGHIMRNNSENSILSVPLLTVWVKEMSPNRDRTQAPSHVRKVQVQEREIGPDGRYTGERGNAYTVETQMPHPLDMTVQVDLWTSNEHQKHQIWEQIFMSFNVGFDIQSSDNPLDWTSLSTMNLDSTTWSSQSIPMGGNDEIDVASFVFKLPLWITPPAKVKQQKIIQQIVTNIIDGTATMEEDLVAGYDYSIDGTRVARSIVTPDMAQISIRGNEITLLGADGGELDAHGKVHSWQKLLAQYGDMRPAESQLRLRADIEQDIDLDIIGTIQLDPQAPNILIWQVDIDTLPANTLQPVNAIIDPLKHFPGGVLPAVAEGQRYMFLNDAGPSQAWGNFQDTAGNIEVQGVAVYAHGGDIVEFKNGRWTVVFKAQETTATHYMVNLKNGKQLRFNDYEWIMAVDGEYHPGFWRLRL